METADAHRLAGHACVPVVTFPRPDDESGVDREGVADVRAAMVAELRTGAGVAGPLAVVCDACARLLPVDGASIAAAGGEEVGGMREVLYASDETAAAIESIHDTLGEGPAIEALTERRPVLVADLAADAARGWPVFAAEIGRRPVGAVFAFPLHSGAAIVGTMSLYRRSPGWLAPGDLSTTLRLVDLATTALLAITSSGGAFEEVPLPRAVVHQAVGMLVSAHSIPVDEAMARLRGHAFATGTGIADVAADITTGRLPPGAITP
ncbi:GAF and ANTAR domain-containing protein [Tomitella cavernea]|uniref:GAF domain-containing protein n=1 Tax=Tomitella cavernea TaxID=1387982 RepID=A0ABP9CYR0_9ACTN|nr:GAF and ANTAR domain-containing protein [Tomitella cavernea]